MKQQVYRISPDGRVVHTLAHDSAPMGASAERVRIVRASHVRFDNTLRKWFIYLRFPKDGMIQEIKQKPSFDSRTDAIAYEQAYCNSILETAPQLVEQVLELHDDADLEGHESSG